MWTYNYTPNDALCHYGVLGMKWGKRKAKTKNTSKKPVTYYKEAQEYDKTRYGQKGVDRIAKRMNNGKTWKQATRMEVGRRTTQGILVSAGLFTLAYVVDKGAKHSGRQATNAVLKAMGHRDIQWLD